MKRLVVAFFACIGASSAAAGDPTGHDAAVAKIAAKLVYAERRCPHLEANVGALAVAGAAYGVSIDDLRPSGRLRKLMDANIEVLKAEHGASDDKIFCAAMNFSYGPDGITMPGAMRHK